jgi:ribonuclease-3
MFSDPRRQKQLQQLIAKLGLPNSSPVNWSLLDLALTHPTISPTANYERLEFVGDAVIRLTTSEFLYATYPTASEGELSALRGILVSDRCLAKIADRYGLERYLLMANSAIGDKIGQENRLAAAFEALLAALYLSTHTLQLIRPWLDAHLQELAESIRQDPALHNYKGALQGLTQTHYQVLPEYRVSEVGQGHGDAERFVAEVWVLGKRWGQGTGQSKKAAEQAAAQEAFGALQKEAL